MIENHDILLSRPFDPAGGDSEQSGNMNTSSLSLTLRFLIGLAAFAIGVNFIHANASFINSFLLALLLVIIMISNAKPSGLILISHPYLRLDSRHHCQKVDGSSLE